MTAAIIEELKYILPSLFVGYFAFLYYKGRDTYNYSRYSTFWPRFWSPSIDAVVLWPINGLIPFFILNFVELNQIQSILIVSLFTFVYPIYSVYFHGQYGATLGKMACKVRVVDVHTGELSIRQALLRDSIPVVFMTILMIWGYLVQLSDNAIENTAFFLIPSVYF